jgi:PST family polysaccharide transporter
MGAHGVLWQGLAQVIGKVVVLLTTIVLARLLSPAEFGLVSLSLVLIAYAETVADAGMAQALVYLPRTRSSVRAALVCSGLSGLGLFLLALLAAPALAAFFGQPDVTPLVRLLAVSLLAASLGALPESLLRRDLLFRRLTVAAVVRAIITGGVSVTLAVAGYGAWSLAWGTVAGTTSYALATWALLPDRLDLAVWRTTRTDVQQVLGYGIPVAGSTMLAKLIFDVDYLIIGRVLGATALGYYTLAFRIPEMAILNVFFVLSTVAFPVYSRIRSDVDRIRSGYLYGVRLYSLYGVCAGVGLAVTAPLLVPVVFGEQWRDAIGPLIPLALYAACRAVGVGANDVYKAMGRPGLSFTISVIRLVVLVPALWLAAVHWGIEGVAWMQVGTSLAFAALMQGVAARVLGLRARNLGRAVAPSLLAGAAVAIVGLPLARLPLVPVAGLVVVAIGGLAAATVVLVLTQRPLLRDLASALRGRPAAMS